MAHLHQDLKAGFQNRAQTTAGWVLSTLSSNESCLLTHSADLIKAETPHLGPRIQLMLSQLEFKLSVEKQYKDGIEKMVRLYELEGDRKSKADAEGRRVESMQKMMLLKQALKRHGDLHVDVGPDMQDGT